MTTPNTDAHSSGEAKLFEIIRAIETGLLTTVRPTGAPYAADDRTPHGTTVGSLVLHHGNRTEGR